MLLTEFPPLKVYPVPLTLKAPRKTASGNVCLCRLLNILADFSNLFCIQANSVDPDQTAPKGKNDFENHKLMTKQTTILVTGALRVKFQLASINS